MKVVTKNIVIVLFACLTLAIPLVLLYIGLKPGGIDLKNSIATQDFTLQNFNNLLFDETGIARDFRKGFLNSFLFASIVGFVAALISVASNFWVSCYSRKYAIGLTFFLLTLTLLPQTYLVMSGLYLSNSFFQNEYFRISFFLLISVLPIGIWLFYFISGERIRKLLSQYALDSLGLKKISIISIRSIKLEIGLLFLFVFILVWGNFLIPFSLGSSETFTATIQISSFTTNLGRDWALICAGGFIIIIPVLLIIIILKYEWSRRNSF